MKHLKAIIFSVLMSVAGGIPSSAQSLSGEFITRKLQCNAEILNDCLTFLAKKDKSADAKEYYMNCALGLFVNKGEPFNADSVKYAGAYIVAKSAYRSKPVKRRLKDYLQGVKDLRYTALDVSNIKIPALPSQIDCKKLVKCGNDLYRLTTTITRELAGYIDHTPVYKDITPYDYSVYIRMTNTVNGEECTVYLSDIEVDEKGDKK